MSVHPQNAYNSQFSEMTQKLSFKFIGNSRVPCIFVAYRCRVLSSVIMEISCDEIMAEVAVVAGLFPIDVVQKIIAYFDQLYNSHLIDIFMIAIGAAKKRFCEGWKFF